MRAINRAGKVKNTFKSHERDETMIFAQNVVLNIVKQNLLFLSQQQLLSDSELNAQAQGTEIWW